MSDVRLCEPQELYQRIIMREDRCGFRHLPELTLEILDCLRRVDHATDRIRVREERREVCPAVLPALQIRTILRPSVHDFLECGKTSFFVVRGIDHLKVVAEQLPVFVRKEHNRVPDLMRDAYLNIGFRKDCLDGFRESFEPVDARDEDILDTAILEVVENTHPEFRAFGFSSPNPEHFLLPVLAYAHS